MGLITTFKDTWAVVPCYKTGISKTDVSCATAYQYHMVSCSFTCCFITYSKAGIHFAFISCCCIKYPFQTGQKTRNVLRRTFRVHPRPLSVWKVAGWSPPGEHGTNSGWTRREIHARPSSTNTERPPEDVPCLPQAAASMKGLGTHTVCKPEPEIPEWTY